MKTLLLSTAMTIAVLATQMVAAQAACSTIYVNGKPVVICPPEPPQPSCTGPVLPASADAVRTARSELWAFTEASERRPLFCSH